MAMSLIGWGMFSLVFLMLIGFVSNQNSTSQSIITQQNARLSCPLPASSGVWNDTHAVASGVLNYTGGTYNYKDVNHKTLTFTCNKVHTIDTLDYFYGTGAGVAGAGMVFFVGDYLSVIVDKVNALLTIFILYISPINFQIFGFTLAQVGATGQMLIFTIYAFCYIGIGAMIYKLIDPFAGGS